jgi:hypothetical protein
MTRIYIAIALVALMLATCAFIYHKGDAAGYARATAERAMAEDAAAKEIDRREAASAGANVDMLAYLRANLPPIEERTDAAVARVRTIYRDRPVAVDACVRPDGVQAELDAARQRANAALRGLRPTGDAGATAPADPRAGGNGRVGAAGDGDRRG